MNTQLILEDKLIHQAMFITGIKTPQEVVVFALEKLVTKQDLTQSFSSHEIVKHIPHPEIAGKIKIIGDIFDSVPASKWEFS